MNCVKNFPFILDYEYYLVSVKEGSSLFFILLNGDRVTSQNYLLTYYVTHLRKFVEITFFSHKIFAIYTEYRIYVEFNLQWISQYSGLRFYLVSLSGIKYGQIIP